MGILIEGRKIFEDDQSVTYAFEWPGTGQAGEVAIEKAEVRTQLSIPDSPLEPAAAKVLLKAYQEAVATGTWPDEVLYAA